MSDSICAPRAFDPIKLEVIRTGLRAVPDLVEEDLTRTAYSPLVYEYKDFAVGVVDIQGRIISLATKGLPMFLLGLLTSAVKDGMSIYGADGFSPGDVIITNHAATLGQHLNNVVMYSPVYDDAGALRAFMAVVVHWIDIGGRYPGSCIGVDNTEVFQEGLQFRTVKLYDKGNRVEEIFRIIECNTRLPEMLLGDIAAQYAGCVRGRRLFEDLMLRHRPDVVFEAIGIIWERSAEAARRAIAQIPKGEYEASSFLDNDGISLDSTIPIKVKVIVKDGTFTVDFSELGAQVPGPYNCGANGGAGPSSFTAFKYLFASSDAANHGDFEPIRIILPPGTFFSAKPGAALGFYQTTVFTVIDTIIAAMAKAAPDRVSAGHHASQGLFSLNGIHPVTKRPYHFIDTVIGGWGGSSKGDGVGPFKTLIHGDARDIPVESIEATCPCVVEKYEWRCDSAGPGRHRGGLGILKIIRVTDECYFTTSFERLKCPPWGLFGGGEGSSEGVQVQHVDGRRTSRQKISNLKLVAGDRIVLRSSGGGGFGPPIERDVDAVKKDVMRGYVSADAARQIYGVVMTPDGEADPDRTQECRARMAGSGASPEGAV